MRRALPAVAFLVVAILAMTAAEAQAPPPGSFVAFGPRIYQNAPGLSAAQTSTFTVANPSAPYHVRIRNGALVDPQYTSGFSAEVVLNGVPLVTFEEFNKKTTLVDKPVTLAATNQLSITVHGRPNALIEIEFVGQDVDDPVIVANVSPSPNAAGWYNADVTVTFICSDATSEIASCPDEQVVTTDGTGIVVSGTAVDAAGRTAVATVTLNVDRTPPQISIGKPTEGSVSHAATVAIEGAAEDVNGVASVTCSGVAAMRVGDTFTCPASLGVGPNTLYAEAMDVAGNPAIASVDVTRDPDFTAPAIAITSPAPLALYSATTVTVTGTVDDPDAAVDVNGRPATLTPGGGGATFTVNDVPLKEGSNLIAATAKDAVDNSTTVSLQIVRDTIAPVVTIENPADGTTTIESSVVVTGMINEMVVGTFNNEQGTVIVNGAPASVENRTFAAPGVQLAIGPNTITAIGTDRAGNSVTVHSTVTRIAAAGRRIETLSGNGQNGIVSAPLANPVAVVVKDETGSPVSGATVIFRVVENNGTLASGGDVAKRALAVATDASGRAEAAWTLGSRAGASNNRVEAYSVGYEGTAIFTAGAASGTPSEILVDAGNAQTGATGQKLPRPLVVVVADAGHNRIEGTSVTFTVASGGASFDGQASVVAVTDGDGRAAAIPTLGPNEGVATTRIQATFAGNAGPPVTFIASSLNAGDAADTTIAGVVLDNANTPVPGATVKIQGTILQTITSPQGQFKITGVPVGDVLLIIDGSTTTRAGTWPMLEFDLVTVAGRENTVGMPIYLLPLDVANGVMVDETHGGTVTLAEIPGFALEVAPNSATFLDGSKSGRVHVTAVHTDKVPMLPSFGSQPRLTVTIQPMGIHFDPPARLTVPNFDSLPPGSVTDMYSFDHDLGQFVGIGTGTVSEDGTVVRSDPGVGVVKGGWHWAGPPTPVGDLSPCYGSGGGAGLRPNEDSCCQRTECQSCVGGAPVNIQLGPVEVNTYAAPDLGNTVTVADTTQTIEAHADLDLGECSAANYNWDIPGAEILDKVGNIIKVKFKEFGEKLFNVKVTCGACASVGEDGSGPLTVTKVTIDGFMMKNPFDPATVGTNVDPYYEKLQEEDDGKDKILHNLGGVRLRLDVSTIEPDPGQDVTHYRWTTDSGTFYETEWSSSALGTTSIDRGTDTFIYWQGPWTIPSDAKISVELTLADDSKISGERHIKSRVIQPSMTGGDAFVLETVLRLTGHSQGHGPHDYGVGSDYVPDHSYANGETATVTSFQSAAELSTDGVVGPTTLDRIHTQWDAYRDAVDGRLTEPYILYVNRSVDIDTWVGDAATELKNTYSDADHAVVFAGARTYDSFIRTWLEVESAPVAHWGYDRTPDVAFRATLGHEDTRGSIGFSQITSGNRWGVGNPAAHAVAELAQLNPYEPRENVISFAKFNNAVGNGFWGAFGRDPGHAERRWEKSPAGYPQFIDTAGGATNHDNLRDLWSKAIFAYNAGPSVVNATAWAQVLRAYEKPIPQACPPGPGQAVCKVHRRVGNGIAYVFRIKAAEGLAIRSWTWVEQALVADAAGNCPPLNATNFDAPPNQAPAGMPHRVCAVNKPGGSQPFVTGPNTVIKTFQFTWGEPDWKALTYTLWADRRRACIPATIPGAAAGACP